ncbi:aminotransferase class I/II-fold pyridoxal phosphate-dependent enzyme [Pelagibacterales bacterium SAG-MED37]|nr:aminotransferase class I/II-fold pyridoxal phosphate-dependent enzyme [Pelagibacterales bacterium SAG-MED37]
MNKYIYPLVDNPFRKKDLKSAIEVIKTGRITMSKNVAAFENQFSNKIKNNFSIMTNSGSSANLLALQCLINPYRKKKLKKGDEVLIPALCWSTSLWPIIQSGLKPVFVDVDINNLNIDLNDMERKISKKTKAIMLVHVLGNCPNMKLLIKLKKKYNLILIEDTCESLGTMFNKKFLGTFGEFSTFSFYSSHQISSGEGGMISCKSREDYEIIKSLRSHGWSRDLSIHKKIIKQNKHLDEKFIFYNSGYNLRPTEVSAVIAASQFRDLDKFKKTKNFIRNQIVKKFRSNNVINNYLKIIDPTHNSDPFWFGIPMILSDKINRMKFINLINKQGLETRPIISGNFAKQPAVKKYLIYKKYKLLNADKINDNGFFIGIPFNKISDNLLNKICNIFEKNLQISKV